MFDEMNRAIEVNQVRLIIDRVFSFSQARKAYRHLASRVHFGKVCIAI